jgi:hypothetical protein
MERQIISMIPAEPNLFVVQVGERSDGWREEGEPRYWVFAHRVIGFAHIRRYRETEHDTDVQPLIWGGEDGAGSITYPVDLGGNITMHGLLFLNIPEMVYVTDLPDDQQHLLKTNYELRQFLEAQYQHYPSGYTMVSPEDE